MVGMAVNPSSNMLLRPDGDSGMITTLYGKAGFSLGGTSFSFESSGGMIERYHGLQFQSHTVGTRYMIRETESFAWNVELEGTLARYGSVTSLDGYGQYYVTSNVKQYIGESLLFRWNGKFGRRSYKTYDRESWYGASTILRLDRFFARGMTLRGQIDAGYRRYDKQSVKPETYIVGFSGRAAHSLRPGWGVMVEGFTRMVESSSSQDSSRVFNRLFLDDVYKYSSTGFMAGTTHLIRRVNNVQLRVYYSKRTYSDTQTSYFTYLPSEGWDEYEASVFLTFNYRPSFVPGYIHPSLVVYHTDVDASENKFSYDSSGITFRIEVR